jgi:hypothetical protein
MQNEQIHKKMSGQQLIGQLLAIKKSMFMRLNQCFFIQPTTSQQPANNLVVDQPTTPANNPSPPTEERGFVWLGVFWLPRFWPLGVATQNKKENAKS